MAKFIGSLGTTKGIRCPLRLYTGMTEPGNQYIYVDLLHVMSVCLVTAVRIGWPKENYCIT